jgi:phenylalanyl-tRNA synthetase alpha chain
MPSSHRTLTPSQLARDLTVRDLTDPAEGVHAIQLLIDAAVTSLAAAWNCQVRWHRGPRVVPVADNYDRLRIPPDAVSRDVRSTRYVDQDRLLRSHSTAMIPAALRALAAHPAPDVLLVCPGVVYRRDAIDRLHSPTPHQLDLWRISRRPLDHRDLEQMARLLVEALTPGRSWRCEARVHPYTLDGRQVDVCWDGTWVEVAECGLAHPEVLERAGLAGWTPYHQLPAQAVARLGIRQGQKNVLVRVVLRHLDRTLTDEEANRLRDRIYAASHQGTVHQWAARSR